MKNKFHTKASVLPTVITLSVIILLSVLFFISFSDLNFTLMSFNIRRSKINENINSARILYAAHPQIILQKSDSTTITLYDESPDSEVSIHRVLWGLYEIVHFRSQGLHQVSIMGLRQAHTTTSTLYYRNNLSSVQITGYTNIEGQVMLPNNGINYTQLDGQFFSGQRIDPNRVRTSESRLPQATPSAIKHIEEIMNHSSPNILPETIQHDFGSSTTREYHCTNTIIEHHNIRGQVIVSGHDINLDSSSTIRGAIIVANKVVVDKGFRGAIQIFASDSIIVQKGARLEYPSGLFSKQYIELGDSCILSGYVIIHQAKNTELFERHYIQSRSSIVRGMVYVDGNAQIRGLVVGSVMINKAIYRARSGSYQDLINDLSIVEATNATYPLWLDDQGERKEVLREL